MVSFREKWLNFIILILIIFNFLIGYRFWYFYPRVLKNQNIEEKFIFFQRKGEFKNFLKKWINYDNISLLEILKAGEGVKIRYRILK